MEFAGKVVIASGAASGISRVIATRFAEAGAMTVIADVDDEWGESAALALRERGLQAIYCQTDVRDSGAVNRLVETAVSQFGRVDILVHGAGVGVHKEIVDLSDDEWDWQVDVQLRGAFLLSRAVGRIHPRTRTLVPATLAIGAAALTLTAVSDYAAAVTFASLTVVLTFALIALSALASRLRQPGPARPYRMPLWPLPPLVALAGVAVTVALQTRTDLAIVVAILAAGALYDTVYLRPRRDTHWILLDPLVDEPEVGD